MWFGRVIMPVAWAVPPGCRLAGGTADYLASVSLGDPANAMRPDLWSIIRSGSSLLLAIGPELQYIECWNFGGTRSDQRNREIRFHKNR